MVISLEFNVGQRHFLHERREEGSEVTDPTIPPNITVSEQRTYDRQTTDSEVILIMFCSP